MNLTFFIVATGNYYEYFRDLLADIEVNMTGHSVQILVLTDKQQEYLVSRNMILTHVEITPEPWPEITLLRFAKLTAYSTLITGDYLIFIDADMRMVKQFNPEDLVKKHEIYLSRHPGFVFNWRSFLKVKSKREVLILLNRLRTILNHKLSVSGWETQRASSAYVSIFRRRNYVQGGFWIATRKAAIDMANLINQRIKYDVVNGYVSVYHDETYLNWFSAYHKTGFLPKDFVTSEGYIWQNRENSFVICVDKSKLRKGI
jgi:hypothetical protein